MEPVTDVWRQSIPEWKNQSVQSLGAGNKPAKSEEDKEANMGAT